MSHGAQYLKWIFHLTQILIDADILLYQSISASEHEVEFEEDLWVMFSDLNTAHEQFKDKLNYILNKVPNEPYRLCFSDARNFRKDINPTYKANRKATRKPMAFKEFRAQIMELYPSITKPALEADDILGILATKPGADAIIVSGDKDLMQIPGKHLKDGEIIEVTRRDGDHFFYTQILTGDQVDGYPGCPGIGKVKAEKILSNPVAQEDPWDYIVEAYEKAGLTEDDALLNARMARILRWQDWDNEQQKVNLWKPYN